MATSLSIFPLALGLFTEVLITSTFTPLNPPLAKVKTQILALCKGELAGWFHFPKG